MDGIFDEAQCFLQQRHRQTNRLNIQAREGEGQVVIEVGDRELALLQEAVRQDGERRARYDQFACKPKGLLELVHSQAWRLWPRLGRLSRSLRLNLIRSVFGHGLRCGYSLCTWAFFWWWPTEKLKNAMTETHCLYSFLCMVDPGGG